MIKKFEFSHFIHRQTGAIHVTAAYHFKNSLQLKTLVATRKQHKKQISQDMKIEIALAFDEAFAPQASTTIASVLANSNQNESHAFHILDCGITPKSRAAIEQHFGNKASFRFSTITNKMLEVFPDTKHAKASYARLLLSEIAQDSNKLLYLDADTIVRRPLSSLFTTDIESMPFAAAIDATHIMQGTRHAQYLKSLKLATGSKYFNAGVMLCNLDWWRKNELHNEVGRWTKCNSKKMLHSDQSALNALYSSKCKHIDLKWNFQTPLELLVKFRLPVTQEVVIAREDPAIIHYTTKNKPWLPNCYVLFQQEYQRHHAMQPLRDNRPKASLADRVAKLKQQAKYARSRIPAVARTLATGKPFILMSEPQPRA